MSNKTAASAANPTSLFAGNHQMPVYYTDQDPPRTVPHTAPSITPYLGLRSRLSQVWINRWTVLLLLVLVRLIVAIASINSDIATARREALSACSTVEDIGSAMASMPHYLAEGVNELTASGVEKAVNGLMDMVTLSVTGVEEIVVFAINMIIGNYECLITAAVGGALDVAIDVVGKAQTYLNTTLGDIGKDINSSVATFETAWDKFIGEIEDGLDLTSKKITAPSLDLNASMEALTTVTLPSSLDSGLTKLNSSIPTFAEVKNFTNNAIETPFEDIKTLINASYGDFTFNRSVLPVPDKETLTFCSDNNDINDFFNDLVNLENLARTIFIVVLVLAAVLVCIPMAYQEVRRWRTMQERSKLVRTSAHDPLDVVYIVSRPYTSTAGINVASKLKSSRRQILTRWVIAYATSAPALFVLSLAVAGLFSCLCQFILLKVLAKEVPQLTNEVAAFADKVVDTLNNASESWATGTNAVITKMNDDVNNDLFGWVNISTTALNNTLNTFVDDMTNVLNTTFGGTDLYDAIMDVVNCLIIYKIDGIEKGLTWVSDNAKVDFPLLPNNTFSLGAAASLVSDNSGSSFLSSGSDASNEISAAVQRLVAALENSIRTEALISFCVLLAWVLIVFIGIVRALTLWYGRDKLRGEGGEAYIVEDNDNTNNTHDVPMGSVQVEDERGPAPKYQPSPSVTGYQVDRNNPFAHEDDYQAQKLGFAGQREYDTLRVQDSKPGLQRASSYGEVLSTGDVKG